MCCNKLRMKAAKKKFSSAQGKKEYLQFIIQRLEKFGSLPLSHLTGHLSQLPSDVRKCIGTSLPEVKIFLRKYTNIFDVDYNDVVHLLLRHPRGVQDSKVKSKSQCPSTSSVKKPSENNNQEPGVNPSEIKNGTGKIQQLFSQTGFIRAFEPFETPVYFTVQNFGDKNKQLLQDFGLKEGALLHFNAIREPPGSLTHYRATQVWFPKKNVVPSIRSAPQPQQMKEVEYCCSHKAAENKNKGKIEHVFDKFGFISSESTGKNSIFFNIRNVVNRPTTVTNLKEILKEGDDVEYCAVKSGKVDSLAPWEATHVFLKKYEDAEEISDDEMFVSSSESCASQSDVGSPKVSETSTFNEKLINSETVRELGSERKVGSLSPRFPTRIGNSLVKKYIFSGRIYIRSEDDAIIISTKRHSCDIAVVDSRALFYVNGVKVAKVSVFQNGQMVCFEAKKNQVSHRWTATLVFVGDKPNENGAEGDMGAVRNIQDSFDASSIKEMAENRAVSSCNLEKKQVSRASFPEDLATEQAASCGDFAGNERDDNRFHSFMECVDGSIELKNQNCVDEGYFMHECKSLFKDIKKLKLNVHRSSEMLFNDEHIHMDEKNGCDSEHQSKVDGSLKRVSGTSAQVCGILVKNNADTSHSGGLCDSKDSFPKPIRCIHKYERCKTDDDCRFCMKQNVNSPYKELCSTVEHDGQNARIKTCCQISNSANKVQEKDFSSYGKKLNAVNQNVMKKFPKESEEGYHEAVQQCRNCTLQPYEMEVFNFQEETTKSVQELPSHPESFASKKISCTVTDHTSELNVMEGLQSVKNILHKCENLSVLMQRDTKIPSPCLLYQDKVNMDIHHVSSGTVHGVLHSGCENSSCPNCETASSAFDGKPVSAFKDFGCQADLIMTNVNKPTMETTAVQTYSTGDILYADVYPH